MHTKKLKVGMSVEWIFPESGPVGHATITSINTKTKTITLDSIPPESMAGDRIILVENGSINMSRKLRKSNAPRKSLEKGTITGRYTQPKVDLDCYRTTLVAGSGEQNKGYAKVLPALLKKV